MMQGRKRQDGAEGRTARTGRGFDSRYVHKRPACGNVGHGDVGREVQTPWQGLCPLPDR